VKVTPAGRRVYLVQYRVGGRKGRTRRDDLWSAIASAIPRFKAKECANYFADAGYDAVSSDSALVDGADAGIPLFLYLRSFKEEKVTDILELAVRGAKSKVRLPTVSMRPKTDPGRAAFCSA
jgi:hypothetical protein